MSVDNPLRAASRVAVGLGAIVCIGAGACPLDHTNLYDSATPIQLSISGPTSSVLLLDTLDFTATVDPRWTGGTPKWSSSNDAVLSLLVAGRYVTRSNGTADVIVTVGPHEGRYHVTVNAPPQVPVRLGIATCAGSTSPTFNALGQSATLCAAYYDSRGLTVPGTVNPTYVSLDNSVAQVVAGAIVAVNNGMAWVRGSAGGFTDSIRVTVSQVPAIIYMPFYFSLPGGGGTYQINYQVGDPRGNVIPGATVQWSSNNPGVIDVDSNGLVTAPSWGVAKIKGSVGSVSGSADVHTTGGTPPAVQSVSAVYLSTQRLLIVRGDVVDAQGDALAYAIGLDYQTWQAGPLRLGTAVQPADYLLQEAPNQQFLVTLYTADESENGGSASTPLDSTSHPQAPVVLSINAYRVGADSLRVDFTAKDNELDAVEVWLVGLASNTGVIHPAPLFTRFTLPASPTAQFSGSVGLRSNAAISQLGIVLRDATGAFSQVVAMPPVVQ